MSIAYDVKVTTLAKRNMRNIFYYIYSELKNESAAREIVQSISVAIKRLNVFPARYPLVEDVALSNKRLRKIVVKNYIIYFWIDENARTVKVVAVIYAKSNQVEKLKDVRL